MITCFDAVILHVKWGLKKIRDCFIGDGMAKSRKSVENAGYISS